MVSAIRWRLAQPYVYRRKLEELRDAAHWWWTYAKALASRGGISAGVAGKIALLERAAQMLRRWHMRAQFAKALPSNLVKMGYGQVRPAHRH